MSAETDILVLDRWPQWTDCHRCGKDTPHKWGLPVDPDTGNIVPTWFEGDWGGIPVCEGCYEAHAQWSEKLVLPFEAPLV